MMRGQRKAPMRALDPAAPFAQWRNAHPRLTEFVQGDTGGDDIGDAVVLRHQVVVQVRVPRLLRRRIIGHGSTSAWILVRAWSHARQACRLSPR